MTFSPGQRPQTHSLLGKGPVMPCVPEKGALSQNSRGPQTSHGVPDPHILSRPLSGEGTDNPPEGVRSRHVSVGAGTRAAAKLPREDRPPTAFNAGEVSALCHNRARGDFCQAVLLIAHYQGA